MTDEEREDREWLKVWRGLHRERAQSILSRLDEPRLQKPEDVPVDVLTKMLRAFKDDRPGDEHARIEALEKALGEADPHSAMIERPA